MADKDDDDLIDKDELEELDVAVDQDEEPEKEEKAPAAPDDGIEALKRQLAAERTARQEAERRAQAAVVEAHEAKLEVDDTNLQLVNTAIDTLTNDMAALKHNYAQAMADQDFGRAADINAQISEQAGNLHQLKLGRDAMLQQPKRQAPAPAPAGDPVESFASRLSPKSAEWIRAHPDCITNPALNSKMLLAHAVAVDDGLVVDTPAYFAAIEKRLGFTSDEAPDASPLSEAAEPTKKREAAPAAAPVSRSEEPTRRDNVVRLTREEREIAESINMSPEEYAKQKLRLIKEGRIGR